MTKKRPIRFVSLLVALLMIGSMVATLVPMTALGAITAGPTYVGQITSGAKIGASGTWTAVMRIDLTSNAVTDSVNSVKVLFSSGTGFSNTDLLGSGDSTGIKVNLSDDTTFGDADDVSWAPDSIAWTANEAQMIFTTDRTLAAAANYLFVAIRTSATVTDGDSFTVTMGTDYVKVEDVFRTATPVTSNALTVDLATPSIPAGNIVGTTRVGDDNDTIEITFSEAVGPADTVWSPNEFTAIQSPDGVGGALTLTTATFAYASNKLTITLDETSIAGGGDNAYLVNGNIISVTPAANAVVDGAGNVVAITKVVGTTAISGDNIAPGMPVNQIIGTTIAGVGDTIAITFSEGVRAADGTWSANEFSSIQSPDGSSKAFANATFAINAARTTLTITLNEASPDSAWLTNGTQVAVTPASGKIVDMPGNALLATEVVGTTLVTGDVTAPTLTVGGNTKFTTDTNMELYFSEAPGSLDTTKISSTSFTVVSAAVKSAEATGRTWNVTISGLSQATQTAGATGAAGLQLSGGAITDRAGNTSVAASNQNIAADTTPPTITSGTLNYSTGVLTITANEILDLTPVGNVTVGNLHINNVAATDVVTLTGATVTNTSDGTTISITLTEAQRAAAVAISGVTGGDGGPVVLDVDASTVIDRANQANAQDDGNVVTETADAVAPTLAAGNATLNYGTGNLVITFVETIDATPATNVDLTKIWVSNTSGAHGIVLTGATVTATDGTTVTIALTAAQKAAAIAISGVTGGDGAAVVVDLGAGAVKDLGGNLNAAVDGKAVTETADTTAPTLLGAPAGAANTAILLTSPTNIDVTFSEYMGAVAAAGSEFTSASGSWVATAAAIDATNKSIVHVTVSGISAAEERGIAADLNITRTALADTSSTAYSSVTGKNINDGIAPTFTIAYFTDVALTIPFTGDYMQAGTTYQIRITSSEDLAAAPTISIAAEGIANDVTGAAMTATITATTVFRYARVTAADAAALGDAAEVITITGTDAPVAGAANTSTNAAVTGEKKIDGAVTVPTLSSPANGEAISDTTPTLTWGAVTDNNGPVTYTFQLDNDDAIALPRIVDQTGLTAATYTVAAPLANGAYYWRVYAIDAFGNQSNSGIAQFVISTDTTAPSVTVSSPNGGETLTVGTATTITWTATDSVGVATNGISISLSTDGGAAWTSIVSNTDNDGAYSWTPAAAAASALIRVTAVDTSGNSGSDNSNSSFTINAGAGTPITSINLAAGWNLISLPLIPTDTAIATVLSGVSASVISVWSYDAATPGWSSWTPALGGTLTTMQDGKGYWIEMSAPATLTVVGTELPAPPAVPPTYSVAAGWNLIGFKSTTAKTVATYLTGTSYRFPIYGYSGGAYTTLTSNSDNLQPGGAYWVYFNAAGTITP